MQRLPFYKNIFGTFSIHDERFLLQAVGNLPSRLEKGPAHLTDFVEKCLQWHPDARMTAASASKHVFVTPLPMSVRVNVAQGKNGLGSIVRGSLDEDVLAYLQDCPTWAVLAAECMGNNFAANHRIDATAAELGLKREFVGYVDAANPPKCGSLNGDPVKVI